MRRTSKLGLTMSVLVATMATSVPASAQGGTVVLGLRSVEGDDALANKLTDSLRRSAKQNTSWRVSPREVSLAQMSLVHGCEEPDASCLTDIALGLEADKLVYGTLQHTSGEDDVRYRVTVQLFERAAGRIVQRASETFSPDATGTDALSRLADRLVASLLGQAATGELTVRANVPEATVWLDGERAGALVDGTLVLRDVEAGVHTIKIDADGYQPYTTTTTVDAGKQARLQVALQAKPTAGAVSASESIRMETDLRPRAEPAADDGETEIILGASLLGGSAILLGAAIYSWVEIENINGDPRFIDYKERVGQLNPSSGDVCNDAEAGFPYVAETEPEYDDFPEVQSMCNRAELLEVLQYVFVGGALAAAGAGTYFLVKGLQEDEGEESATTTPRFTVTPPIGGRQARVSATLRF